MRCGRCSTCQAPPCSCFLACSSTNRFRVQLVSAICGDPVVRSFWLNEYAGYGDGFRTEAIAPIQNKIGKALIEPRLRNMLAQPKSTITLRRLMDEGAIVICNISGRVGLGESTAHLLGALLTTAIAQAALSRADTPAAERRTFHLYADEFQSFATGSFALILSEARKYALTLTIGHQYLDQLPDRLRDAVFGNAGSIIACRSGPIDAPILAEQIGLGGAGALLDLPEFSAWARLLQAGVPTSPIRLNLYDAPHPRRPGDAHRLIGETACASAGHGRRWKAESTGFWPRDHGRSQLTASLTPRFGRL